MKERWSPISKTDEFWSLMKYDCEEISHLVACHMFDSIFYRMKWIDRIRVKYRIRKLTRLKRRYFKDKQLTILLNAVIDIK